MKVCKEIVKEKKLYIVIALFSKFLHFYMRKLKKNQQILLRQCARKAKLSGSYLFIPTLASRFPHFIFQLIRRLINTDFKNHFTSNFQAFMKLCLPSPLLCIFPGCFGNIEGEKVQY